MAKKKKLLSAKGVMPAHYNCVDCGINTMPVAKTREEIDNTLRASSILADPDKLDELSYGPHTEIYHRAGACVSVA